MKQIIELVGGMGIFLVVVSSIVVIGLLSPYGIYHSFSKHSLSSGVISIFVPPFAWYRAAEGFFWHDDCVNVDSDPYSSNKESYPDNWEPRVIQCLKYDYIPDFTLGYYSDPREDEIEFLCSCIDKNIEYQWVKDTGRKFKNGEEVTNIIHKGGFPTRLGEKIKFCTKDARRD